MGMLEQSREYFHDIALPSLRKEFPELMDHLAAGLVGNGSECYGYDDELSLDHDCGIDFCLWVDEETQDHVEQLKSWKCALFEQYPPRVSAVPSAFGSSRDPIGVKAFYRNLIGVGGVPQEFRQWLAVPEENLSLATNGEVFFDNAGLFSAIREGLLGYVPEELRRKRIAAWCMQAAQAGQYNLERMWHRGDIVAIQLCKSRFIEAVVCLVFALNRTYRPYYKWAFRMMCTVEGLGKQLEGRLIDFAALGLREEETQAKHLDLIESICATIIKELKEQGLSSSNDSFLVAHGIQVQASIRDERLARFPAQMLV